MQISTGEYSYYMSVFYKLQPCVYRDVGEYAMEHSYLPIARFRFQSMIWPMELQKQTTYS